MVFWADALRRLMDGNQRLSAVKNSNYVTGTPLGRQQCSAYVSLITSTLKVEAVRPPIRLFPAT